MEYNKTLIAIALATTLAACSDSKDPTPTPTPEPTPTPPVETVVEGKAIKGVLTDAIVTVYKFVDGAPVALTADELTDANITTDDAGNYSFTVLDYDGPIKIELSPSTDPDNPTTMTCDAPAGCGDTAFGAQINLTTSDPTFTLAAISVVDSTSTEDVKVNVSALTHLASELIEASDAGVTTASVTEESAKVATTFGIEGDITLLEPTVTDDAAAVAGEDNEAELKYGLINAGIMSALFSGEEGSTAVLSTKLAEVALELVANNGALLVNQDDDDGFELALADVLTGAATAAAAAAEAIAADTSITDADAILDGLAQEAVDLANEQAYQEANTGDDGLAVVVTEVPTEGDAVTKAKAMVADMRMFTHLFDDQSTEGAGLKSQGDQYATLLENASTMINAESEAFTLLSQISEALADISMGYDAGTITADMTAAGINIATYITGATGSITFDEETATGGVLFNVDVTSGTEMAMLNATAEFSDDGLSIVINIDGSVESAGASFTLNDGSFAQINFDSAASRTAFEDDTFEGEVVSGELDLSIALAQKSSDAVTDPVTFTGMLTTTLLPVQKRVIDEYRDWDDNTGEHIINYDRPEFRTIIRPEILSLSGGFSSLGGDLIEATVTADISNLAEHQAPDFKYIGKEIAGILNLTFSDNTVVWTEADSVIDEQQYVATYSFTEGATAGDWTGSLSVVTEDPDKHWAGAGYEHQRSFQQFTTDLGAPGLIYTNSWIMNRDDGEFFAKSVRMTPIDNNQDGVIDGYQFERINTNDETQSYTISDMISDEGVISLSALINSNNEIITDDGAQTWDNATNLGIYSSLEDFVNQSWEIPYTPDSITTVAQYFESTLGDQIPLTVEDEGKTTIFIDDEERTALAAGEITDYNPTAYLTEPLIKDAFSITVSADNNTVTVADDFRVRTYSVDYTSPGNFIFNRATIDAEGFAVSDIRTYSTNDVGLDIDEVSVLRAIAYDDVQNYRVITITPVDDNQDGITDYLNRSFTYSDYINDAGVLVDETGAVVAAEQAHYFGNSYAEVNYDWWTPFNPFTVTNALDISKEWLKNARGSYLELYLDGIGSIERALSDDDYDSLVADSTTLFDGYNTVADTRDSLEDEDNFLNVNAAISLEAILGDYQVKLQLSGDRSALEQGAFDLDMSYRLPGADTQRSFTVQYNTEEEGQVTVKNADDVVLLLEEPDENIDHTDSTTGPVVIGRIIVGPTTVAATIENRDDIIVIVYSDETTDTLN